MKQTTNTVLMIRPVAFRRNDQTAMDNHYQQAQQASNEAVQTHALEEFDRLVEKLREATIEVMVVEDKLEPGTPDSIFPNNWLSTHQDGLLVTYPMYAPNRRLERREDIVVDLLGLRGFHELVDLSWMENEGSFLEGTGSLVLDRENMIAYAALSERTSQEGLKVFSETMGYKVVTFQAFQSVSGERLPVYHTNVIMSVGQAFAVVCLEAIDDLTGRDGLRVSLEASGKEIIDITEAQAEQFAGNILQLLTKNGNPVLVMSSSAYQSYSPHQRNKLAKHGQIVHSPIDTIERLGGGSARCMLAEVFLPQTNQT